jgi:hypothetical protein
LRKRLAIFILYKITHLYLKKDAMPITLNIDSWKQASEVGHHLKILNDLETGNVILLPRLEFTLLAEEKKFLTEDCADPKSKHISFDPQTSILRGSRCTGNDLIQLRTMVYRFANQAHHLVESLFPHYKEPLQWGRTSFRPFDAAGRKAVDFFRNQEFWFRARKKIASDRSVHKST